MASSSERPVVSIHFLISDTFLLVVLVLGDLHFHLLHFHFDLLGLHGSGLGGSGLRLSGSGDLRGGLSLLNRGLLDLGQLGLLLLGNGLGLLLRGGGGLFGLLLVLSALLALLGILILLFLASGWGYINYMLGKINRPDYETIDPENFVEETDASLPDDPNL